MQQPSSSRSTKFPLGIGAPSSRKAAGLPCLGATHRIRQLLVPAQKSSAALLEGPFFNRAMARVDDRCDRRINRAISSVAVMMLAANRIAPNVMVARPELTSEVLSKLISLIATTTTGVRRCRETRKLREVAVAPFAN